MKHWSSHVLFMQCATHLNLGWRIIVLNREDPIPDTAPPPTRSLFTDTPTIDSQLTETPPSISSRKISSVKPNNYSCICVSHNCLYSLWVRFILICCAVCRNWDWSTANRAAWCVWDTVCDWLKDTLIWRLQLWWFRTRYIMRCFYHEENS